MKAEEAHAMHVIAIYLTNGWFDKVNECLKKYPALRKADIKPYVKECLCRR